MMYVVSMINCEDYALLCQNSWEVYSKILRNILRDITDVVQILYGPDRRWLLFATAQKLSCAPNGPRFSTQHPNAPGVRLTSLSQFLRGPAGALLSFYLGAGTNPPVLCMFWLDLANKQVASSTTSEHLHSCSCEHCYPVNPLVCNLTDLAIRNVLEGGRCQGGIMPSPQH